MTSILQDLCYAARLLRRAPAYSAAAIAILALGIGANSAVFSLVNAVLLRPLPYHDPARLYRFDEIDPSGRPAGVSPADARLFRDRIPALEAIALSHWQNLTLTGPQGPENLFGGQVSSECFPMLARPPILGRLFRDAEFRPGAPPTVLLSYKLWLRRFAASPAVLNSTLMLNGIPHTIIGVMPEDFFYDQRFALWTPWQFTAADTSVRTLRTPTAVRLRPGATAFSAQAEALAVLRQLAPEDVRGGWTVRLVPLASQLTQRVRSGLLISLSAVAFVLLIACFNVAHLTLARSSARAREIALRCALGAGRLRVARQLLTESLLLAFCGGAAGLLLGAWAARSLATFFPGRDPIPRLDQTHLDSAVFLFTFGVTLLTGLLTGLIPALDTLRTNLSSALNESARGNSSSRRSSRLRNTLIVAETALSLILLTGAGLMLRAFQRLNDIDPGVHPSRVLTLRVPLPPTITGKAQQPAYYTRILDRLNALPGLESAGLITPLPLADVDANIPFIAEGRVPPPGQTQLVKLRSVSPGYFRAMGIGLRQGRLFDDSDALAPEPRVLVSQTLARRFFPGQDPVGRRITRNPTGAGPFSTILGVVDDVPNLNLAEPPEPELYFDYRQLFFAPFAITLVLRTHAADPLSFAPVAQQAIRAAAPDQPIADVRTMAEVLSANLAQPRLCTLLLTIYAAIALLLAATGLYGVLSCAVTQRSAEIGVRLALGASRRDVFRLVAGQALTLVALGALLGLAGSLALTRLIASQLYRTQPTDPPTFAAVIAVLLAVAAAATIIPTRRATRIDPATILRTQ